MKMKPRGFGATVSMYAGTTFLPFALLVSWLFSLATEKTFGQAFIQMGLWMGIGFGIFFGLKMGYLMQAVTISVKIQDRDSFIWQLNIALAELGYHPESQVGDFLTYKPSFQAGLLSGKISVQIENESAQVVGPSTYLLKLQRRVSDPLGELAKLMKEGTPSVRSDRENQTQEVL